MSTSMLLILIGIGILTGVMAGMLGIGGAIIMIPALVFFMGFSQQMAQGTSLAVMLPPIGIIAAYNYYKAGQVNIKFATDPCGLFPDWFILWIEAGIDSSPAGTEKNIRNSFASGCCKNASVKIGRIIPYRIKKLSTNGRVFYIS